MGVEKKARKGQGYKAPAQRIAGFKLTDLISLSAINFTSNEFKKYASDYAAKKNIDLNTLPKDQLLNLYQQYLRRSK